MTPDEVRSLYQEADRLRQVREDLMNAAHWHAHSVARRVSDMLRDDSFRGPESVDSLQRLVVEYETAWLAYLSATEEWKQASDAYAAAHGQLATRTRTQTDAPA